MTRQFIKRCCASALALSVSSSLMTPVIAMDADSEVQAAALPKNEIFFDEPVSQGSTPGAAGAGADGEANRWQQLSLPIGNSYMGANFYGETDQERLTLNDKTLWTGGSSNRRPDYNGGNKETITYGGVTYKTSDFYKKVVEAFKSNASDKVQMADALTGKGQADGYGNYEGLGDLILDFEPGQSHDDGVMADGWMRLDDRDSRIQYSTGWGDYGKDGWHEGTEKFTTTVGASFTLEFTGTGIRLNMAKNSPMGAFDVYIDDMNTPVQSGSMYAAAETRAVVFETAALTEGKHTLKFVNKTESGRCKASLDSIDILPEGAPKTIDLNPDNADETNVTYANGWGMWGRSAEADANEWVNINEMFGSFTSGTEVISLTFKGTGIALYGAIADNTQNVLGSFAYSIDGKTSEDINCRRGGADVKRIKLFEVRDLEDKEHTVRILSRGGKLSFDCFVINPIEEIEEAPVTGYRRSLDIDQALGHVEYVKNNTRYTREYLVSYPDDVMAIRLQADGEETMNFDLSLPASSVNTSRTGKTVQTAAQGDGLLLSGTMNDNQMKFAAKARVVPVNGGTVSASEDGQKLEVRECTEAVIYYSSATDYKNEYPTYRTGETDAEVIAKAADPVDAAVTKGYDQVKTDHIADYTNIYDRVELDLGQTKPDMPTDELLAGYKNSTIADTHRRYLEQELYQYGRYLQISSSREGDELPANLQGVWSIYSGEKAPWGSDYHMNVNLQMNYWPTYSANMAECALPMISYEDSLREPGRVTASTYFGIDNEDGKQNGYTAHTQNTPFGWTCPGWAFSWGWSPAAVPWMLQNVYEYYEYTGDEEFLESTIFPMMKEQAKLYETILTEVTYNNGKTRLATVPAYSPEHGPYTAGNVYENTLVWQLFNDCLESAEVLNAKKPGTVDAQIIAKWTEIMEQLDPIELGSQGQIKEWYDETTIGSVEHFQQGHRHMSHLLGLFPGDLISSDHPEYMDAAVISLNERGDNATGWGLAQRINAWARAKDGNRAMDLIESLFRNGMYNNLWDAHAPFQIDGNFGYTSGVTEMLMQSNASTIELLPAMPDEWAAGSVNGIVARGNFELGLNWSEKKLTSVSVLSKNGGQCRLDNPVFGEEGMTVRDSKGQLVPVHKVEGKTNAYAFETKAGESYTVEPGSESIDIDTSLLETAYNKAADLDFEAFSLDEQGAADFAKLIEEVTAIVETPETQQQVNAAAVDLNQALLALRRKPDSKALENFG